ncbi:MAG: DNA repair protein RecN [Pseudomonadales bacterium]|jgi:DNA repair protein RecN (Recombination protein N)|nr:DNA repair protein RecN [Pseudomonadales bacterium]MDP6469622.1 DNA repair protein RecN [Pseudomonadales bacterium]MDP6827463.1 DNA repair protein RecN [Pseudomonadales bacterium]MDP6973192.1 DNA repair protein RecN [Pseudomonadales bacterium]|tara:strand:+ start:1073 stop:2725 length:1653 start_codon:yes stop_codon:yes gene_type:complete
MLKQLTVRNFALVEALDIDLQPGLTVITGESGAGKSILVGALSLAFGQRASIDLIRPGTEGADVSAEFDVSDNPDAAGVLASMELTDPDHPERVLLRRAVRPEGRSRAFVNGVPVTLAQLRTLTDGLVDIHGQDENQRLVRREVQLQLLDAYGVNPQLNADMRDAYRAWQDTQRAAQALRESISAIEDRETLLRYQLDELEHVQLEEGEFERLETDYRRLSQARQLRGTITEAAATAEDLGPLRQAASRLQDIGDNHHRLEAGRSALLTALQLADDAHRDLTAYLHTLDVDEGVLGEMENRLDALQDLARKHRVQPQQLYGHIENLRSELQGLTSNQDELQMLQTQSEHAHGQFMILARKVSEQRAETAGRFASEVSACMNTLGIADGALAVEFEAGEWEHGLESLEFKITTNPRYPSGSLGKIASGGERARISLAIEVAAAEKTALPCLVLDEADVGVGGATADVLGRLLRDLGAHTQVLCITHAPQVAALGDHHLLVEKDAKQDTRISALDTEQRTDEVARMLAGSDLTDKTRAYAATLLDEATAPLH